MNNTVTKVTGEQVKALLAKAVGGIYISRYFDVMTDFYTNYTVNDEGLEIAVSDIITAKIPIDEKAEYYNFAVGSDALEGEDRKNIPYEEWESSSYFDYKFEISNIMICFNVTENDRKMTWEQFKELVTNENHVTYSIQNIDGDSMYFDMKHCEIVLSDVEDSYFEIYTSDVCAEIDKSVVECVCNNTESGSICYQLTFNNGMSDMTIVPERSTKVF